MFSIESEIPSLKPDILVDNFFGMSITNSMTSAIVMTIFFLLLGIVAVSRFGIKPNKFQLYIELFYLAIQNFVKGIINDDGLSRLLFPVLGTLFFYILFSNIFTIFPFISAIQFDGKSLFRTHTFDINTTLAFSLSIVLISQLMTIRKFGILNYIFKFVKIPVVILGFKKGLASGILSIIDFMIGFLDVVSEFAKIVSLALRLFGNMFAGDMLMALVIGFFAIVLPLPVIFLGLFSGVVQAIIFTALTTTYLVLSVKE
ncbi:F0F1 ATP synthase subunit A [Candidatus Dojkabacteria bacterium]|nr:F0F1 ATP synthase subunit A [Candidatus Dojkabacteria bacterium]